MEKKLYIDASHPEETRIVLKSENGIEEYEYEDKNKLNFKNNIYLGTVSRVEPSLQAAFINFGRTKHGFLAFNDIQSDYYQIPTDDKERLQEAEEKIREDLKNKNLDELSNEIGSENEATSGNNKTLDSGEQNSESEKNEGTEPIIEKNETNSGVEIEKKNTIAREKLKNSYGIKRYRIF